MSSGIEPGPRASSPVWISKLLGSVWKDESDQFSEAGYYPDIGHGDIRHLGLSAADGLERHEDCGRSLESCPTSWHPPHGPESQLQHVSQSMDMGNTARRKPHTESLSNSHEAWGWGRPRDCGMRRVAPPIPPVTPLPPGLPCPAAPDMLRRQATGSSCDERDLTEVGSPNLPETFESYGRSHPRPIASGMMKSSGYQSYGPFPARDARFVPSPNPQRPFHSQSPFDVRPDNNTTGSLYTKKSLQEHGFPCPAQTQQGHQPFSYQHHSSQLSGGHAGFHNSRLYTDIHVESMPPREPSHLVDIPRSTKGYRRNSLPHNEPTRFRGSQGRPCTLSPQLVNAGYRDDQGGQTRYASYAQPELGKPQAELNQQYRGMNCSPNPVFSRGHSQPSENFHSYQGVNNLMSSPGYQRLSPPVLSPSPSTAQSCPTPTASEHSTYRNHGTPEFFQPPSHFRNIPPTNPGSDCLPRDAGSRHSTHAHAQKHRRERSPEGNKKSEKQPRGAQNLPPCRVCGNKASGLHFGVNTCEACNEFFRRSLKRGANYHCSRNLSCKVWGKKRSPCSSCRYRRCLEVGMSRNRIKTGRYSHRTRAEYAQEIERNKRHESYEQEREKVLSMLEALVEGHDRYIRNSSHIPEEDILRAQEKFLSTFRSKKRRRARRRKSKSSASKHSKEIVSADSNTPNCNPDIKAELKLNETGDNLEIQSVENVKENSSNQNEDEKSSDTTPPVSVVGSETTNCKDGAASRVATDSTDKVSVVTKTSDLDTISFVSPSPGSSEVSSALPCDGSTSLTDDQRPDTGIGRATDRSPGDDADSPVEEDSEATDSDYFSDCMGLTRLDADITERWLRSFITYAKLVPGFKHLPISDQANLVRASWFEFWFLGAYRGFNSDLKVVTYPIGHCLHVSQMRSVFGEEYCSVSFHMASRMKSLQLSAEEMVLMKTVCLLSPDRCELVDKEAVEKMHWAMISALLHVLEKNRPNDKLMFPRVVSKMVELR